MCIIISTLTCINIFKRPHLWRLSFGLFLTEPNLTRISSRHTLTGARVSSGSRLALNMSIKVIVHSFICAQKCFQPPQWLWPSWENSEAGKLSLMPPLWTVIHCHWSANDLHNMPIFNGSFQGIVVLIWTWRSDALVDWGNLGSTFHWVTYSHFLGSLFGLYWNSTFITLFTISFKNSSQKFTFYEKL